MKRRLLTILIFILLGLSGSLQAYNFSIINSGNNLYFKIKDIENKYVEVTSELESGLFYSTDNKPTGSVVIPSTVSNNGITYYVISIGENAFSGCDEISSITIPNSITSIQSAAFSNCTGINTITFLGLPPTISSSAFISIPTIIPVNVYCNLGLSYYSAPNFTFSNIQEMPCPVISDTTKYIEIKGTNAITNLYLQGGNGMQWVKKGNEGLVFYPGGAVNISNSANKKIKIYGDFTYLKCSNASLNHLDISHSTSLVNLDCSGNLFDSLTLNSTILKSLTCGSNQLQYLNLGGCSSLEKLNSSSSLSGILNNLKISGCNALKEANFTNQKSLTELNISNLPQFTTLKIDRSSLSTIIADNSPNFDTIYCKQISSSCTYDSLLTSLPTKESGRIGFIYFGDSITTEQSSCRDYTAIAKGWKFYYKTPSGVNISKTPNTDYTCFIVSVVAQPNDITYGSVAGGGSYEETAEVILEAIPFANNIFLYWSDDQTNTNAIRTVIAQDTTFTAVFRHFNLVYDTIAICQGAHYQFFNTSLSDAGDYNYEDTVSTTLFNLQNLNLSLKPIFNTSITAFICEGETYTENGFNETLTGIYTDTLQAINGCDSILHLDLTVNPIYNDTITAFICQGETYTQFGFSQTTAGIYTQSLQTINGCDSIVNLSLITNPIHNDTIRATICQGETYSLNGFSETSPGLYTQNLQDINGCDSIVNLSLLVNRIYNITFNAAIYNGQTYSSNGFNQSIAGFYTQNLQTINGCDSIVNLNLMLYPLNTTMLEESICQGEAYTENGFNENISGLYSQTLDDINGGDSIVSLNLIVNPIFNDTIVAEICQGDTYSLNGFNEDQAGFYTQTLASVFGCDSIVNLTLFVNPSYNDTIEASICQGQVYTQFGFNQNHAGIFTQNLQTTIGCDSIVNLKLTVNPKYNYTILGEICQGETYDLFGFNETQQGIYTQTLQTTKGCDSIINLSLFINPTHNDTIVAEICQGETYDEFGFNETTTGFYTQSLQTTKGCDSIINLSLLVNPSYNDTIEASICEGETYSQFDFNEIQQGIYTHTLQTIIGCDSIVSLKLIVNPIYEETINATICQTETYTLNGFNVSTAGLHTRNLQTTKGCDSIINLSLLVNPSYNDTIKASICQGQVYNQFGFNENTTGFYTQSLLTTKGCDSIISLSLIVNPTYKDTITANICQGTTYTLNGFNQNTAGIYTQNLQTTKGCDSIVSLRLIVSTSFNDTIVASICQGQVYTQFGFIQTTTGLYTQSLLTQSGCDSIINLKLTVNPTYFFTHNDTICKGERYTKFGFNFISDTSKQYTQNLQTIKGCDSIIKLNLIVNPSYNQTISARICQGQVYNQYGFNATTTDFYTQNLLTTKGCDSIINLSLIVYPNYQISNYDTACIGQQYSNFGYNFIADTSGIFTQNLQSVYGCDSIVTLYLTVNATYTTTIKASICQGNAYTLNGFNQNQAGTYTQNLQNRKGCDSIINLNLSINPTYNDTIRAEICRGSSYTQNGFNENMSGFYTKQLQTTKGCDSIVNLILTVNPTYYTTFTATICQGETYNLNGFSRDIAGTYTKNLQTIKGCDSIVELVLSVIPSYSITRTASICKGQVYNQYGFNETTTGIYTQNLQKQNGCDSIITLNLTVNPTYNDTITASICRGSAYTQHGFNETTGGFYTHYLQTTKGCDSIINLKLTVNSTYSTTFNAIICQGESYNLNGFNKNTSGVYTEIFQTTKGCDSIVTLNLTVNPTYNRIFNASICKGQTYNQNGFYENQTGTYVKNLQTINGCDSTVTLNLIVNQSYNDTIRASICRGGTYNLNGFNETQTGYYSRTLQTTKGCDSIINLKLTVNPSYTSTLYAEICQGETYTLNGFNHNTAGVYTEQLQTINGCDSLVTLNLVIFPTYNKTLNVTICENTLYTQNGFNESTPGLYTNYYQSVKGCDSIVNLNLTVNNVPYPTNLTLENIQNYFKLSWQGNAEKYAVYRDNDLLATITNKSYKDTNVVIGHTYCYRVQAQNGECGSKEIEICQEFIGLNEIESRDGITILLYPNPTTGNAVLELEGIKKATDVIIYDIRGRKVKTYKLNANQKELNLDLKGLSKGIYQVKILNQTKKLIVN